ncbi:MAG: hypothetical protein NVSMB62_18200 [Acidobacteriaceae bacterium]
MPQASALKSAPQQIPAAIHELAPSLSGPASSVLHAMLSDAGRVRHANEDCCGASPELGAYVLCDGMGGAAAGEVASQLARDTFLKALADSAVSRTRAATRLATAIRTVNQAVHRQAQRSRAHRGMGTTLVALLCEPASSASCTVTVVHVGDSRCYLLRAGTLQPLTRDHSLIEEQVRAGVLTAADAASSPIRNIITRAIGTYPTIEPEIAAHPAQPGDLFLLASDGLTRELDEPTIANILLSSATSALDGAGEPALDRVCHALVDAANAHGGGDNITVLLVAIR